MKEFDVIEDFFKRESYQRKDVLLGIGDDCAITQVPDGQSLVTTTDTLISGVHFPVETQPADIAHKALAVNLSDLAAMGAEPAWISLSLSMPEVNEAWLGEFSRSLKRLTEYYSVQLIGGDTVKGPLSITITAQGFVPCDQALTRSKAKPGDHVYVTGSLGDAGAGLALQLGQISASPKITDTLQSKLNRPTPQLLAGTALRRIANACIDVSDGLVSDITHILNASECGAVIDVEKLPLSDALINAVGLEQARRLALSAGDDYELLFTVEEERKNQMDIAFANYNVTATCIGQLNGSSGKLELKAGDDAYPIPDVRGFEHFSIVEALKDSA